MAENIDHRERLKERVEDADLLLALKKREQDPLGWAEATLELAEALSGLADLEPDTAAFPSYHDAVLAYQEALSVLRSHEHFMRRKIVTTRLIQTLRNYGLRQGGENGLLNLHYSLRLADHLSHELSAPEHGFEKAMVDVERGQLYRALAEIDRQENCRAHLQNASKTLWAAAGLLRAKEKFTEWAFALNALGLSLKDLSLFEDKASAQKSLQTAIDAFKSIIAFYYNPDERSREWALAQLEKGRILILLAKHHQGKKAMAITSSAIEAFKAARSAGDKVLGEERFIRIQEELAQILSWLATNNNDKTSADTLAEAVALYRDNLERRKMQGDTIAAALTQGALGRDLAAFGLLNKDSRGLELREEAVDVLKQSVTDELKHMRPQEWLANLVELATTLHGLANDLPEDAPEGARTEKLEEVIALYDSARDVVIKEKNPFLWAQLQQWQALVFAHLGEEDASSRGLQRMKLAELGFRQALTVFTFSDEKEKYRQLQKNLGHLLYAVSQRKDCPNPVQALTAAANAVEMLRQTMDETTEQRERLSTELHLALILWRRAIMKEADGIEDFTRADQLFTTVSAEPDIPPIDALELKGNHAELLMDWGGQDLSRTGLKHLKKARTFLQEAAEDAQASGLDAIQETAENGLKQCREAIIRHRKQQPFFKRPFWR